MSDYTPFPGSGGAFPPQGNPAGGFPQAGGGPAAGGFPQGGAAGGGFPQAGPPAPRAQAPAGRTREAEAPPKSRRGEKAPKGPKAPKEQTGKPVTKRLFSRQVIFAVVFALIAALAVLQFLKGADDNRFVVRATADIAAGTAVSGVLLEAAELPADAIEPNTFSADTAEEALAAALEEVTGVVTQYPLSAKAQIRSDQFGLQATLGAELTATERLVSVRASVGTSVAGGLVVGDRVDIIGAADGVTRVVAYNVPIMSITVSEERYDSVADQQSADKDVSAGEVLPGNPVPGIYVVKVPAEIVPALLNWNESAVLYMAYRPAGAVDVIVPDNYLSDPAVIPVAPAAAPAAGDPAAAAPVEGDTAQD